MIAIIYSHHAPREGAFSLHGCLALQEGINLQGLVVGIASPTVPPISEG